MIAKKRLLLAAMAVGAVVVVAAAAAQAEWRHGANPLVGAQNLTLSGSVKLEVAGGHTYTCPALIKMTILEGAEGKGSINSYEPVPASCEGTGAVAACKLASTEDTTPWVVDAKEFGGVKDAKATNVTIEYKFKECMTPNAHVEFNEVTMTPDKAGEISSFTLSGEEGGGVNAKISGTMFLTEKQKTFGIK